MAVYVCCGDLRAVRVKWHVAKVVRLADGPLTAA